MWLMNVFIPVLMNKITLHGDTYSTDTGESRLLNLWYCFWEYFSETVPSNRCFLVSSFSCFTSYKLLLTSQENNKWPQMLFSKNFNTVHMIQAHTEEYLVTRNYWHPRLDFIMRNTNTVWILCLCPVFLLHCNLFENRMSGILQYAQSLKKYLKSSKGLWSIYFDENLLFWSKKILKDSVTISRAKFVKIYCQW